MRALVEVRETYRLIVQVNREPRAFAGGFDSFEHAQSRVADAVRGFCREGTIDAVVLQSRVHDAADEWRTCRTWDRAVVDRILQQHAARTGLPLFTHGPESAADADTAPTPVASGLRARRTASAATETADLDDAPTASTDEPPEPALPAPALVAALPADEPPAPAPARHRLHKDHGWHYAATVAFVAIIWIAVLTLQTGGQFQVLVEGAPATAAPAGDIPFHPSLRDAEPRAEERSAPPPQAVRPLQAISRP